MWQFGRCHIHTREIFEMLAVLTKKRQSCKACAPLILSIVDRNFCCRAACAYCIGSSVLSGLCCLVFVVIVVFLLMTVSFTVQNTADEKNMQYCFRQATAPRPSSKSGASASGSRMGNCLSLFGPRSLFKSLTADLLTPPPIPLNCLVSFDCRRAVRRDRRRRQWMLLGRQEHTVWTRREQLALTALTTS